MRKIAHWFAWTHCMKCQRHRSLNSRQMRFHQHNPQLKPKLSPLKLCNISNSKRFNSTSDKQLRHTSHDAEELLKKYTHIPTTSLIHKFCFRKFCTGLETIFTKCNADRHNGVTVDLSELPATVNVEQFHHLLKESVEKWRREERSCIWLKVPIEKSTFISIAAQFGFQFHHAEHQMSLLKLWLNTSVEDRSPRFATHQVGVAGLVYREDTKEILVVKDKNSQFSYWKFPGGLSELGEDIDHTAEREVFEETGIRAEFLSVLAMRQQHRLPGAFGRSDIFIVCRLKPLTFDIEHCQSEISHCQWMSLKELYANTTEIAPITHRMCQILLHGQRHGFQHVDVTYEEMKSVYKGLRYKLYHRPLPNT